MLRDLVKQSPCNERNVDSEAIVNAVQRLKPHAVPLIGNRLTVDLQPDNVQWAKKGQILPVRVSDVVIGTYRVWRRDFKRGKIHLVKTHDST